MKDIIVLYHGDCSDGFGAAWAAYKKFGDKADYIGIELGEPPVEGLDGKEIYMLDFVYPENYLKDLLKRNKKIIAIDHHKTNSEIAKLATEYKFDLGHSGAVLSWEYFHSGKEIPKLLKYVEDVDLWRFNLENVNELFSYISIQDYDFKTWSTLAVDIEDEHKTRNFIEKGEVIIKQMDKMTDEIIKENSTKIEIEEHKGYAVNAPHVLTGLLSKKLINKDNPLLIRWAYKEGYINLSFRSDGSVDVSELAKKFGGGGHKAAAGARFKLDSKFPWKELM